MSYQPCEQEHVLLFPVPGPGWALSPRSCTNEDLGPESEDPTVPRFPVLGDIRPSGWSPERD